MSRKDYVATAEILATIDDDGERQRLTMAFCRLYHANNIRFSANQFITAVEGYRHVSR